MTRHGLPTAIEFAGMSPTTTDPAPMIELSPMTAPGQIVTFAPSHTFEPMRTGIVCSQPSRRVAASNA